jgi:dTDP-glucose 4,6-dehydratase
MGFGEEMIEYVTDRPGHDRRYAIDATKINALGWQPEYTREKFRQGLSETVDWYKANTGWVKALAAKKADEMNTFQQQLERSTEKMKASIE